MLLPLVLEVNGGRVEEDEPDFAEKVAPLVKERLLDQMLCRSRAAENPFSNCFDQPCHRPVKVLEGQLFSSRNAIAFLPHFGRPVAA